jgi:hypothetical protein
LFIEFVGIAQIGGTRMPPPSNNFDSSSPKEVHGACGRCEAQRKDDHIKPSVRVGQQMGGDGLFSAPKAIAVVASIVSDFWLSSGEHAVERVITHWSKAVKLSPVFTVRSGAWRSVLIM